ncbi:MAG: recombination mediator RecR [Bdellovibrionales bacterium]|nr:recombination mediator RecR [Bdellovibrionales bacterium]
MVYKHHVPSLDRLIHELKKWPGVGPRSANRWANWLLKTSQVEIQQLRQALKDIKTNIKKCPGCFTLTEDEKLCYLCDSPSRRKDIICIVEEPFDIAHIEASGKFKGQYHVLHGALSPLNNISPADLTFGPLMDKIRQGRIKEVILALDADMEGDITALYIGKMMKNCNVKVSRLAHGIPFGGDIDYIDEQTLGRALENRVEI